LTLRLDLLLLLLQLFVFLSFLRRFLLSSSESAVRWVVKREGPELQFQ
jgi:hypothetical protein